jgi:hypothetical protein
MIARFPDNSALTSAYSELMDLAIPKSCIAPCFEETGPQTIEPEIHCSFLEELYRWHAGRAESGDADGETMPASPHFRNHGGVLKVNCGPYYMQGLEVVLRHDAVLVG